jgi:hypothetical protein
MMGDGRSSSEVPVLVALLGMERATVAVISRHRYLHLES